MLYDYDYHYIQKFSTRHRAPMTIDVVSVFAPHILLISISRSLYLDRFSSFSQLRHVDEHRSCSLFTSLKTVSGLLAFTSAVTSLSVCELVCPR